MWNSTTNRVNDKVHEVHIENKMEARAKDLKMGDYLKFKEK